MTDDIKIDAEFKEGDHPRANDGKFGSGGGSASDRDDPAVVNIPLSKRGNIDNQLDKFKERQAKEKKESEKKTVSAYGEKKEEAKNFYAENSAEMISAFSVRMGKSEKEIKSVFDNWVKNDPEKMLLFKKKYEAEKGKADMSLGKWVSQADADPLAPILDPGAELPIQAELLDGSPAQVEPYTGMDDLAIAEKMASGEIDHIVATDKCLLVPMRITGTGITERTMKDGNGITIKYPIDRPADVFLSDRFLQMCNGLPVCFYHPQDGEGFTSLNFDNWKEHTVGTIFYPYIKGSEVWGVAKIFDLSMLDAFRDGIMSTSPFVTSTNEIGDGVYREKLEDINHVAIVPAGHWDTDQPAITANKEIQYKEDLMADKENPVAEPEKADANVTQVNPAEPIAKPDAEPVQAPAGDDQPAEDARFGKLESAVASLTEGMAAIKASLDALVESDKAVHEGIDDPVVGEDEEKKAEAVNALTEMADSAHAEVKIVKPVPMSKESVPEYKRRIIAHNVALVDPEYAGLAKVKADSAIEPLLDKGIASIGVNAKKKSDELYRSASTVKNARVALKNGVECIPNF